MNIFEAISKVMNDVGAIGKNSTNDTQHYKYRGVEAVMNALQPALIKHHVFVIPEVLEQIREERTNSKGTLLIYSMLKVRYKFYAEDGTFVEATVVGEGMDSGDKASNKAMSAAFKYACFQTFCIPTEEMVDSEADSHEVLDENSKMAGFIKKISADQKVTLLKEVKRVGQTDEAVFKWLKVNSYEELDLEKYNFALTKLKSYPSAPTSEEAK